MLALLANILLRQAEKTDNPADYLDALVTSQYTTVSGNGGIIISASVNGKSTTLQMQDGTSPRDIMLAASMALEAMEAGLRRVPTTTVAMLRG